MIGLRVKASLWAFIVVTLSSCGAKTTPAPAAVAEKAVPAGAERWDGAALYLPMDSPAVLVTRLDNLLGALGRFRRWLVAEPAMFGEEGVRLTRQLDQGWLAAVAYLGVDPLSPAAWRERGVDPTVPIYAGLYPVSREDRRYVSSVENVLREELGIPPGGPLASSMNILTDAGGRMPEGTHARVDRVEAPDDSAGGFRVVLGVTSVEEFLLTAKSFSEGSGYRVFPSALDEGRTEHNFWSENEWIPTMSLHFIDQRAVFDFVVPALAGRDVAPLTRDDLPKAHAELVSVVDSMEAGRASAPSPVGRPTLAVAFDQASFADHVRLVGYRKNLVELRKISADRRDIELVGRFLETAAEAEAWAAANEVLTGTVFEVDVPTGEQRIGSVAMTMFGARALPTLDTARTLPSLNLGEQSVGLGVQLGAMRGDAWTQWFGDDAIVDMRELELGEIGGRGAPAILRSVGVAIGLAGHPKYATAVGRELGALLGELTNIDHVELVSAGPDVMDLGRNQLFCSVVMARTTSDEQITDVQNVIETAIAAADEDSGTLDLPKLSPGQLATTPFGKYLVHQQLIDGADTRILLSGVGVTSEDLNERVSTLGTPRMLRSVLYAHVEPVALLPWIRDLGEDAVAPLDADVLAQRIGAIEMRLGANPDAGGRAVTMSVELREPPKLP